MLRLLGGARGAGTPLGEERGGGISCRHTHSLLTIISVVIQAVGGRPPQYAPPL